MVGSQPEELAVDERPDRPISRLRRYRRRRPVGWWALALLVVLVVMILLPKLLDRWG